MGRWFQPFGHETVNLRVLGSSPAGGANSLQDQHVARVLKTASGPLAHKRPLVAVECLSELRLLTKASIEAGFVVFQNCSRSRYSINC